jgi:hypothetical protein
VGAEEPVDANASPPSSPDLDAYPGMGWSRGLGHLDDAAHIALAEAIGVPVDDLLVYEITARDEQDQWLVLAQGFSSEGVEPATLFDGILAWQATDWARHFETGPVNEEVAVGDLSVLRTSFPIDPAGEPYRFEPHPYALDAAHPADAQTGIYDSGIDLTGDAVQYLYVSGDTAFSLIAIADERAVEFLAMIP